MAILDKERHYYVLQKFFGCPLIQSDQKKYDFRFRRKSNFFRQITKFLLISRIHVVLIHYLKVKNNLANQQKLRDLTEKFNFSAETEI